MTQKERIDIITDIIKKHGFVTVKYLMQELHYSTATIYRDLNVMENQNIIKRSYGGAEFAEPRVVPLFFRNNKMKPVKNKIAKKAAELVENGDVVFIDCSTTAQCMGTYLTSKKDITVITNNISLASYLSENGITTICLGGMIMEPPSMIYSSETVESAQRYGADKLFFSPNFVTFDGKIGESRYEEHILLIKAMMKNSKKVCVLFDHDKITDSGKRYLCSFDEVDALITNYSFSDEIKKKFQDVEYIEI